MKSLQTLLPLGLLPTKEHLGASQSSSHSEKARWPFSLRHPSVSSRFSRGISAVSTSLFSTNLRMPMTILYADILMALPDSRSGLKHFWNGLVARKANKHERTRFDCTGRDGGHP